MTMNEYQELAARTIRGDIGASARAVHALHGMVSEVGELHGVYQKVYQGHKFDREHAKKELGDLMWFVAEYAGAMGWTLEEVAQANVDKLRARYPEGFDAAHSLHRAEGDV